MFFRVSVFRISGFKVSCLFDLGYEFLGLIDLGLVFRLFRIRVSGLHRVFLSSLG